MLKYFLIISVILNSILLMSVLGVVPFLLYLSILINISAAWFIYNLINRVEDVSEDIEFLFNNFHDFSNHLEKIHELEMFYGEPVLQNLINHSKQLVDDIEEYKFKYEFVEEKLEEDDASEI